MSNLYERINTLFETLYRRRNYLHKLYKFHNVVCNLSPEKDIRFEFYSMYGMADIIFYTERGKLWLKYWGKTEFELCLTKNITCDNIVNNRIRELETYIYSVFGYPQSISIVDKMRQRWKRLVKNLWKFL